MAPLVGDCSFSSSSRAKCSRERRTVGGRDRYRRERRSAVLTARSVPCRGWRHTPRTPRPGPGVTAEPANYCLHPLYDIDIDTTVGTHSSKQPAVAHLVLGSRSAPHSQTIANLPGWGRARPQSSASSHNHSRAVSTSHTPSPHSAAKWQRLVELDVHACDSAAYLASPAG